MSNIFRYFVHFLRRRKNRTKVHEEENVVESMVKAKKLYKELILKAHPDRHPNKIELAALITEKVNENRYNYQVLLKLKERIEKELLNANQ